MSKRRVSPQVFSFEVSESLRSSCAESPAVAAVHTDCCDGDSAALEAIAATLQLFELCQPAPDASISAADLERTLRTHLGPGAEADRVLGILSQRGNGRSRAGSRLDFLEYWQGMDRFFADQAASIAGEEGGTVWGMRRFRDGVLSIRSRQAPEAPVSSEELLRLLEEIRVAARDVEYWDEVAAAVSKGEGGLSLAEVAEAVYVWLKDYLREDEEADEAEAAGEDSALHHSPADVADLANMSPSCSTETESPWQGTLGDDLDEPCSDLRRAHELVDFISRLASREDPVVHQALARLQAVHGSVERALERSHEELTGLSRSSEVLRARRDQLEAELVQAHESSEQLREPLERERDEHRRRAAALEREADQLREERDEHRRRAETDQRDAEQAKDDEVRAERDEHRRRMSSLEHEVEELREERAEYKRRTEVLEAEVDQLRAQVKELNEQCASMALELETLRDACASAEDRERQLCELQSAEVGRLQGLEQSLAEAECKVHRLQSEAGRLRRALKASSSSARSFAEFALECEESAALLTQQLSEASSKASACATHPASAVQSLLASNLLLSGDEVLPAWHQSNVATSNDARDQCAVRVDGESEIKRLEERLEVQQSQIKCLRAVRDELLAAHGGLALAQDGMDDCSPRQIQWARRCRFIETQLSALLRHSQVLDQLVVRQDPAVDQERLSLQEMQHEFAVIFAELSDSLHTLEVQKADVDQDASRLRQELAVESDQLRTAHRRQKKLIADLHEAKQCGPSGVCTRGSASQGSADASDVGSTKDPGSADRDVSVANTSIASGAQASNAASKTCPAGFLFSPEGSAATLQSSPKKDFGTSARRLMNAQRLASVAAAAQPAPEPSATPEVRKERKEHRKEPEERKERKDRKDHERSEPQTLEASMPLADHREQRLASRKPEAESSRPKRSQDVSQRRTSRKAKPEVEEATGGCEMQ